jgi:hypothetical protein
MNLQRSVLVAFVWICVGQATAEPTCTITNALNHTFDISQRIRSELINAENKYLDKVEKVGNVEEWIVLYTEKIIELKKELIDIQVVEGELPPSPKSEEAKFTLNKLEENIIYLEKKRTEYERAKVLKTDVERLAESYKKTMTRYHELQLELVNEAKESNK